MHTDYHVHTCYSDDSECPMEEMVQQAISLGLDEIAFTEHVDYGVKTDLNCRYQEYFKELQELQEKYKGRLDIKKGIEFGVQKETIPQYREDFSKYDFDFVILSNHQIHNQEFWNQCFQKGKSQEEFQRAYYDAILDVVKNYKEYSVLGHLDMIKRYDKYGNYSDENIMDMVELIFHYVISEGKGIEVNTSCFRYGLEDLTPSRAILGMYYEMGGRILTLGSDAHAPGDLGCHMEEAQRELRKIGFTQFCTFEKMQPIFHSLRR
ncbi:MAG: histidinol-phosphatase HisJ family protein [Lachnospiraceae bacterium]|nr:histidinol-phosphatase HisJ family protein [Lachnospiraceae bacterium]